MDSVTKKGTTASAGFDVFTSETVSIAPHSSKKIRTGIAMEMPSAYFGEIKPRSSLALRN